MSGVACTTLHGRELLEHVRNHDCLGEEGVQVVVYDDFPNKQEVEKRPHYGRPFAEQRQDMDNGLMSYADVVKEHHRMTLPNMNGKLGNCIAVAIPTLARKDYMERFVRLLRDSFKRPTITEEFKERVRFYFFCNPLDQDVITLAKGTSEWCTRVVVITPGTKTLYKQRYDALEHVLADGMGNMFAFLLDYQLEVHPRFFDLLEYYISRFGQTIHRYLTYHAFSPISKKDMYELYNDTCETVVSDSSGFNMNGWGISKSNWHLHKHAWEDVSGFTAHVESEQLKVILPVYPHVKPYGELFDGSDLWYEKLSTYYIAHGFHTSKLYYNSTLDPSGAVATEDKLTTLLRFFSP